MLMIFPYYLCNNHRILNDAASYGRAVYNLVPLSLSLLISRLEACRLYKSLPRILFGFIDFSLCYVFH